MKNVLLTHSAIYIYIFCKLSLLTKEVNLLQPGHTYKKLLLKQSKYYNNIQIKKIKHLEKI